MSATHLQAQFSPTFELTGYGNTYFNSVYHNAPAPGGESWENVVFESAIQLTERLSMLVEMEIAPHIFDNATVERPMMNVGLIRYALNDRFNVQAGVHSPYNFNIYHLGVNKSMLDHLIVPYNWRGLAAGISGELTKNLHMDFSVLQSLNHEMIPYYKHVNLAGEDAVHPVSNSVGMYANLDWKINYSITLSGSYYFSDVSGYWGRDLSAMMHVMKSYIKLKQGDFMVKGAAAMQLVSGFHEMPGSKYVPTNQRYGAYMQFGYNIAEMVNLPGKQSLILFTRNEVFNEHLASAYAENSQEANIEYTIGMNYHLRENILFKADFQRNYVQNAYTMTRFNVGLTYGF